MSIEGLLQIMARLRDPEGGCPWDRQQTFATIAPYTLEEAYEVADAIARNDVDELRQELGDLLFQVVFYSQIAKEQGAFDFAQVVEAISDKMLRRHPHVFADAQVESAEQQHLAWERMKREERKSKARAGVLDEVALALPALMRAQKLQKRAARVGFDWPDTEGVQAKIAEELAELDSAVAAGEGDAIEEEMGDLLFSCVNLARHLGVDAEQALRRANGKFEHRFGRMEEELSSAALEMASLTPEQWEGLWQRAKANGAHEGTRRCKSESDEA